ncbi:MAG: DUF3316 domain-containing protein [Dysgonamonadaceae bacterium]|jgi:hypothetical protein|nr:DUF3316 domain-containing protein [Dysgonamonadaceae bacterium]
MKKLSILLTTWLLFFCLFAQEEYSSASNVSITEVLVNQSPNLGVRSQRNPWVNHSTMIGVGKSNLLDTYLSPVKYDGRSFSILHDRVQGTRFFDEQLLLQQQFHIVAANTTNPVGNATEYYGNLNYRLNGLYPIMDMNSFRLFVGGGLDASLGGIYNTRNSNNPGSAKASGNLNATVMARYNWNRFTFRWQLSSPFVGMFFSPGFGQSYYEMFELGNNSNTVHFGSLHNQQALRNYFTVDIPVWNFTIRTGYLGDYYRTDVNSLITRISTHQFVIGLAFESLNLGGRRQQNIIRKNSVFY